MHRRQLLPFIFFFFALTSAIQPGYAAQKGYIAPEQVTGTTLVTAADAKALHDNGVVFIDVRSPRLYNRRHIPGVVHLDLKDTFDEESLSRVAKKDQPLVIYCSGIKCSRSSSASADAVSWGFKKVHYFRGGIVEWRDAGYPVESSDEETEQVKSGELKPGEK
jgi:rhodanese-related sulfurtransferase